MTMELSSAFMEGKAYIAVDAFGCISTDLADQQRRIPAAILKKDHLLFVLKRLVNFVHQHTCKVRLHGFILRFLNNAYYLNFGELYTAITFVQLCQSVFFCPGV